MMTSPSKQEETRTALNKKQQQRPNKKYITILNWYISGLVLIVQVKTNSPAVRVKLYLNPKGKLSNSGGGITRSNYQFRQVLGPHVSHLRGIYCAFSHCYINVIRKKFNSYKYIIPFNSKIKSKKSKAP